MPIEFHCPFCDQMLRTPDARAGLQANCPGCGEKVYVPRESELEIDASRPSGSAGGDWFDSLAELEAKPQEKQAGFSEPVETFECPMCGGLVDVTEASCPGCGEPTAIEDYDAPQAKKPEFEYAGFWLRFLAAMVDGVIVGIPTSVVVALCFVAIRNAPWLDILDATGFWLPQSALLLIAWPYYAPMESSRFQATFGKMLLGLIVTDEHGERASFARTSGRHWSRIFSSYCCMFGYIAAGLDDKKQAWHDGISGCLVIRKPADFGEREGRSVEFDASFE